MKISFRCPDLRKQKTLITVCSATYGEMEINMLIKIIGSVIEKVYVLFAIFLLFKTSVEIINFIISPD